MRNRYRALAMLAALTFAALWPSVPQAEKVYKWTDAQGNVSYQDHPPPANAAQSEAKEFNPQDITTEFTPAAQVAPSSTPPSPPPSAPAQTQAPQPTPITKRLDRDMMRKIIIGAGAGTGTNISGGGAGGAGAGSTPAPPSTLPQFTPGP